MSRASSRRRLGRAGSTSLEAALTAVLLVNLIVVALDVGRYFLTEHSLRAVTSEAVRAAVADSELGDCSAPKARVGAIAPMLEPAQLVLCVTREGLNTYGLVTVKATATYPFSAMSPLLSALDGTVSERASLTYVQALSGS